VRTTVPTMRRRHAALAVAQAVHRIDRPLDAWLEGIAAPMSSLLGVGMGTVVVPFGMDGRIESAPSMVVAPSGDLGPEVVRSYFERVRQLSVPGQYARILRRSFVADRPVKLLSSTLVHDDVGVCQASVRHAMGRAYDHVGLFVSDGATGGLSLTSVSEPGEPLRSRDTALLSALAELIGRHLALRRTLRSVGSDVHAQPVATLDGDGRIRDLHPSADAMAPHLRRLVRRAVRQRRDRDGADLDLALRAWRGLFDGTWAVLHRFDEDGRGYWVVHRCRDHLAPVRALTIQERRALVLRLHGWRPKSIARRLQVPDSSVRTWLSTARNKLGDLGWRDLAALFVDLPRDRTFRELTDLEPEDPP